jgi:hypothetical protein
MLNATQQSQLLYCHVKVLACAERLLDKRLIKFVMTSYRKRPSGFVSVERLQKIPARGVWSEMPNGALQWKDVSSDALHE